jgi:hypothetical protein
MFVKVLLLAFMPVMGTPLLFFFGLKVAKCAFGKAA